MASNKPFRFGPVALSNTLTTNILNPGTTTGGTNSTGSPYGSLFLLIRAIRIVNKTAGSVTVSLWIGGSAGNVAGTEHEFSGYPVPANSYIDSFLPFRLDTADFLVGGASAAASLTIVGFGEIGVA